MKNILVVDDDASVRQLFKRLGAQYHWKITLLARGEDALAALKADRFELVFLDVNLGSGLDGTALAKSLREYAPDLRIVMMSGDPTNSTRVEVAGFGPMLAKPFELSAIDDLVNRRFCPSNSIRLE